MRYKIKCSGNKNSALNKGLTTYELELKKMHDTVNTYTQKINLLVDKMNSAITKICDVLDEHDEKIKHNLMQTKTVMDSMKSLATAFDRYRLRNAARATQKKGKVKRGKKETRRKK